MSLPYCRTFEIALLREVPTAVHCQRDALFYITFACNMDLIDVPVCTGCLECLLLGSTRDPETTVDTLMFVVVGY
jgi:hypothetical protein